MWSLSDPVVSAGVFAVFPRLTASALVLPKRFRVTDLLASGMEVLSAVSVYSDSSRIGERKRDLLPGLRCSGLRNVVGVDDLLRGSGLLKGS